MQQPYYSLYEPTVHLPPDYPPTAPISDYTPRGTLSASTLQGEGKIGTPPRIDCCEHTSEQP